MLNKFNFHISSAFILCKWLEPQMNGYIKGDDDFSIKDKGFYNYFLQTFIEVPEKLENFWNCFNPEQYSRTDESWKEKV